MPRLLTVTVYEGVDLAEHREPYVMVELLDISGRPIKHERARTKVKQTESRGVDCLREESSLPTKYAACMMWVAVSMPCVMLDDQNADVLGKIFRSSFEGLVS